MQAKMSVKIGSIYGKWRILEDPIYAKGSLPTVLVECLGCGESYRRALYQVARSDKRSVGCASCLIVSKRAPGAIVNGIKVCSKCKVPKSLDSFHRDKLRTGGRYPWCKVCANPSTLAIKKRHRENRDGPYLRTCRRSRDRKYFGNDKVFDELIMKQAGGCAICRKVHDDRTVPRFAIDHCHATKIIRGVLCADCNKGLGYAKDNPEILRRMIEYLGDNAQIPILSGEYSK